MSGCMLISDHPLADYEQFMAEAINELNGRKVLGVALVALLEDNEAITGYHGLDLLGKQVAAAQIQSDITDAIVRANIADYIACMDEENDECEED